MIRRIFRMCPMTRFDNYSTVEIVMISFMSVVMLFSGCFTMGMVIVFFYKLFGRGL